MLKCTGIRIFVYEIIQGGSKSNESSRDGSGSDGDDRRGCGAVKRAVKRAVKATFNSKEGSGNSSKVAVTTEIVVTKAEATETVTTETVTTEI